MKKLLFLLAVGSMALSAQAQESTSIILNSSAIQRNVPHGIPLSVAQMDKMHSMPYCKNNETRGARTTSGTHTEWYDLWNQNYTSGTSLGYYFETFGDSNLKDPSITSGSPYTGIHGMGMCFDPTDSGYFSTAFNFDGGLATLVTAVSAAMPATNSAYPAANPTYTIDSIYIPFHYERNDNTVTDSIII